MAFSMLIILAKGVQPDSCYYVNAADSVIVETQLDLDKDPPPDIAIEIDVSNSSKRKSSIYAALKISEFWRYDGRKFQIFRLTGADYTEIPSSQMLPGLTAQQLLQTINLSRSLGQTAALQRFRTQF